MRLRMIRLALLLAGTATVSAFTLPSHSQTYRQLTSSSSSALYAIDAMTVNKNELLSMVLKAPSGRATPRRMSEQILDIVRQLEVKCPTPNEQVLASLQGSWELLWTAQDPNSPESKTNWILNPIENQQYSINPEGRANPILPLAWQDRLEKAGWISATPLKSTQTIDSSIGLIRNIVALNIGNRRGSITVYVRGTPDEQDPRKINVKFERFRVSVTGTPIRWDIPLGITGPRGWLSTVYIDEDLRVTRGHKGSVFILSRPRRGVV